MATKKDMQTELAEKRPAETADIERTREGRVFIPRTDIFERENDIVVTADMPGVDDRNVDIHVEKNVLTISGKATPSEHKGMTANYTEYETGDYQRTFTLSNEIDVNRITASIKDGVLHITLPKSAETLPRKIIVTGG